MASSGVSSETVLRDAGLRPTRQRRGMVELLQTLSSDNVSADEAHRLAAEAGLRLSLATTYNILNQFAKVGLVRRVDLGERTWFCTSPAGHHHFLDLSTGRLSDIPGRQPVLDHLPTPPPGYEVEGVDILVRIRPAICRE
ncbi:Fe2+/Zn2+ uptake regulation protein [Paramagnetospirillum caucaseum]|uniref:Fe2+/Zn2+ uptake regulation protein n=1 Tax=Paramagnetospirillum caucaseum TaxID=1244869 RepID=M2ZP05_9PROT|nr:Fur family transcriptional regulator [Paramagnetospirillum caucaseum]EME69042.1 Fe2+/Zn2+ uptake regulation protein [Paramagnetospirillum caucaseum]